jgi:hypothetical protein
MLCVLHVIVYGESVLHMQLHLSSRLCAYASVVVRTTCRGLRLPMHADQAVLFAVCAFAQHDRLHHTSPRCVLAAQVKPTVVGRYLAIMKHKYLTDSDFAFNTLAVLLNAYTGNDATRALCREHVTDAVAMLRKFSSRHDVIVKGLGFLSNMCNQLDLVDVRAAIASVGDDLVPSLIRQYPRDPKVSDMHCLCD